MLFHARPQVDLTFAQEEPVTYFSIPVYYCPSTVLYWYEHENIIAEIASLVKQKLVVRQVKSANELLQYVQRCHCEVDELRQWCQKTHAMVTKNIGLNNYHKS